MRTRSAAPLNFLRGLRSRSIPAPCRRSRCWPEAVTEIAKAISQDAKVLVLDEPSTALAVSDVERLFVFLQKLKAEGVAISMSATAWTRSPALPTAPPFCVTAGTSSPRRFPSCRSTP